MICVKLPVASMAAINIYTRANLNKMEQYKKSPKTEFKKEIHY